MVTGLVIVGAAMIGFLVGYYVGGKIADNLVSAGLAAKKTIVAATFGATAAVVAGTGGAVAMRLPASPSSAVAVANTPGSPAGGSDPDKTATPIIPAGYTVVLETNVYQERADGTHRQSARCVRAEHLLGWASEGVAQTQVDIDCDNEDLLADRTDRYLIDLDTRETRREDESTPLPEKFVEERDGLLIYSLEETYPSGDFTYNCYTTVAKDPKTLFRASYSSTCKILDGQGQLWGTYGMVQQASLNDHLCDWASQIIGTWQVQDTSDGRRTYTFRSDATWTYLQYELRQPDVVFNEYSGTWICLPENGALDFMKGDRPFSILRIDPTVLEWDVPKSSPLARID